MKRVLVTGMSGLIGSAVRTGLEGKYELSALNRSAVEGVEWYQSDITDLGAIEPAFKGIDIVVHLAAIASATASWEEILNHNVTGTYNVFEAARQAGVKRVVYASSGATVTGWESDPPYNAIVEGRYDQAPGSWDMMTHKWPTRPKGLYGCSKVWGEALARHFSDAHGISAICLRIGAVNKENRPYEPRHFSVWCSQRDIVQMVEKCIEAPEDIKFDIFYATSNNKWGYRDLEHAREAIGFVPQDAAEDHRPQ